MIELKMLIRNSQESRLFWHYGVMNTRTTIKNFNKNKFINFLLVAYRLLELEEPAEPLC